jgi:hypothetical protein
MLLGNSITTREPVRLSQTDRRQHLYAIGQTGTGNQLSHIRPYVIALMEREGRDFNKCELGGEYIHDEEYEIHHTKYEGAIYRDLRIVCRSCNQKAENKLLN